MRRRAGCRSCIARIARGASAATASLSVCAGSVFPRADVLQASWCRARRSGSMQAAVAEQVLDVATAAQPELLDSKVAQPASVQGCSS